LGPALASQIAKSCSVSAVVELVMAIMMPWEVNVG
jgi:hypothetical protein